MTEQEFKRRLIDRFGDIPDEGVILPCLCGSETCDGWRLCFDEDDVQNCRPPMADAIEWSEFSLEWIGRIGSDWVVSVIPMPGDKWLVLPKVDASAQVFSDSLQEAKKIAESLVRKLATSNAVAMA